MLLLRVREVLHVQYLGTACNTTVGPPACALDLCTEHMHSLVSVARDEYSTGRAATTNHQPLGPYT